MTYGPQASKEDAIIFCGLLDGRFNMGYPRRHQPGLGKGEEEVLLQPSPEVMDFLLGPPPEMVRAVRPKLDNFRPVRERHPKDLVGHRLEMRQIIGEHREVFVATVYYLYTLEELEANAPLLLRQRKSGEEDSQYSRHVLPTGEALYIPLGPLRSYGHDEVLGPEGVAALFRFIGGCACREP